MRWSPLRWLALAGLCAMTLVAVAACDSEEDPGVGILSGEVVIGPLCPAEPCEDVENPYVGREVIISKDEVIISSYTLDETGTFTGELASADYIMDMEPCEYDSCSGMLPQQITIRKDQTTPVTINLDTGIR